MWHKVSCAGCGPVQRATGRRRAPYVRSGRRQWCMPCVVSCHAGDTPVCRDWTSAVARPHGLALTMLYLKRRPIHRTGCAHVANADSCALIHTRFGRCTSDLCAAGGAIYTPAMLERVADARDLVSIYRPLKVGALVRPSMQARQSDSYRAATVHVCNCYWSI